MSISRAEVAKVARDIIVSQTEDIEFIDIVEISNEYCERDLSDEEHELIADVVSKAQVEVVVPFHLL